MDSVVSFPVYVGTTIMGYINKPYQRINIAYRNVQLESDKDIKIGTSVEGSLPQR